MPIADVQSPLLAREGGADWLSLALIDARNRTLAWLAVFERARAAPPHRWLASALWLAGRGAWLQERWIVRCVPQRALPLASIEPNADAWWGDESSGQAPPDFGATRAYLAETIEATLDLLARTHGEGALHAFRSALHHEDRLVESFAALAQAQGLQAAAALLPPPIVLAPREPLWFAAQRVAQPARGWRPDNEAGDDDDESLPEFEIDAQAVSWQQFVEFMADGGYDDERWWSAPGWAWVQANQRRAPRDLEQWRHGVLVQSFGRPVRVGMSAPVMGVSRHEAEAWCRWAGKRLPAGIEWQLAALQGASRGFVGHQASEWVLGRARDGSGRAVQRGVPWFAPRRLAHPALRTFVEAERDDGFSGFRSCAL